MKGHSVPTDHNRPQPEARHFQVCAFHEGRYGPRPEHFAPLAMEGDGIEALLKSRTAMELPWHFSSSTFPFVDFMIFQPGHTCWSLHCC